MQRAEQSKTAALHLHRCLQPFLQLHDTNYSHVSAACFREVHRSHLLRAWSNPSLLVKVTVTLHPTSDFRHDHPGWLPFWHVPGQHEWLNMLHWNLPRKILSFFVHFAVCTGAIIEEDQLLLDDLHFLYWNFNWCISQSWRCIGELWGSVPGCPGTSLTGS